MFKNSDNASYNEYSIYYILSSFIKWHVYIFPSQLVKINEYTEWRHDPLANEFSNFIPLSKNDVEFNSLEKS